jgi:hypothetical protein
VDDLPAAPKSGHSGRPSERRDVRRAIEHWHRNTWGNDCVPFLDTFDFSPMRGDWGYRFLLCGSQAIENSVFVKYGSKLARLLRLPDTARTNIPFIQQIPVPFRDVFVEGYDKAYSASSPVALKGTFGFESKFLLYRAVFMPIMLQPNWSKQLILGSFNCRVADAAKAPKGSPGEQQLDG